MGMSYFCLVRKKPIYTIGHGSRKAAEFLALLKEYGIGYLIDARSVPFSKFHPQFSQNELKQYIEQNGIRYVFMGDELGGRPKDASCYRKGMVDYEILKTKDFFKKGIERLKTAYNKELTLAIMCSERNPIECHRSRLIGRVLDGEGIVVQHIDETGKLKDQKALMSELYKGFPPGDLFGNL
jgi:uncharacterized protein (DUF488 family)